MTKKSGINKKKCFLFSLTLLFFIITLGFSFQSWAQNIPQVNISFGQDHEGPPMAGVLKVFLLLTLLSVAPAMILTMTSFTRIIIVISFLRQAIGVHQSPPNQVVVGLALFLTFFIMSPVINQVNQESIQPFFENKIDYKQAYDNAVIPIKTFMFKQTRKSDLEMMLRVSKSEQPKTLEDLSMTVMIPSFILSELKTAFEIGFLIYLPFVLIDMVVAMVLLTMGMMVLPPIIISLPFKLMLFVLVDGWNLIMGSMMESFR